MRVAKCILSLKKQNVEDIEFTYQRIFRFLADILSIEEFQSLSYYHVTRMINKVVEVSGLNPT